MANEAVKPEGTNPTNPTTNPTPTDEARFTQGDVDRIVAERLTRERAKLETQFAQRAMVVSAKDKWTRAGHDAAAFDALEMGEDGKVSIDKVLSFADSMNNRIKALEKAEADRKAARMPFFGGSCKSGGVQIDRLAEAFKAPGTRNKE